MPSFKVETQSSLNANDTYKKVKDFIENDPSLRKLDGHYKCDFNDGTMSGKATGKQFTAELSVAGAAAGATVTIKVELPFLLSPFKGKIQSQLESRLGSILTA